MFRGICTLESISQLRKHRTAVDRGSGFFIRDSPRRIVLWKRPHLLYAMLVFRRPGVLRGSGRQSAAPEGILRSAMEQNVSFSAERR